MILAVMYDLKDRRDYAPLLECIKSLGDWMHYIESAWLLDTSLSPNQVYQALGGFLNPQTDYLLVIEVGHHYFGLLPKDAWDWLEQRDWKPSGLVTGVKPVQG